MRYDGVDVPVTEALATAEALVLPQVRARGLVYLPAVVSPDLSVRADVEKLQQILLNLLGNAIKFTDRGGDVRVICSVQGATVSIAVTDTGIGIAPEKLVGIFEPFVQIDQRLTRANDGAARTDPPHLTSSAFTSLSPHRRRAHRRCLRGPTSCRRLSRESRARSRHR